MKNLFLLFLLSLSCVLYAQTPVGVNYQAVLRDAAGLILKNQSVTINVTVRTKNGPSYKETIMTNTNEFGLLNVIIGQNGGANGLKDMDWASGDGEIELTFETNNQTLNLGTQGFQSVPYAFHAEIAKNVENDAVDDADADPNNELQMLSYNDTTGDLTLSNGNTITIKINNGDDWGEQSIISDTTLSGNGTPTSPLIVNGDLTDDQNLTFDTTTNILSISEGNTVDLSSLSDVNGTTSLWKDDVTGIYVERGAYIGHPKSTARLHFTKSAIDFIVRTGDPKSLITTESMSLEKPAANAKYTADSIEFKDTSMNRSILSKESLNFEGHGFQSNMTKNEVKIHGIDLDSYTSNTHDSIGFTSKISGFLNGESVQNPYSFKVGNPGSNAVLDPNKLQLMSGMKYAKLSVKNLIIGENGLGNYVNLYGSGYGQLTLLNGGNWAAVTATGKNGTGEVTISDGAGHNNIFLGSRVGSNGTGTAILYNNDQLSAYHSSLTSGAGTSQLYGPNRRGNVILSTPLNLPNHGYIGVKDADGNIQAGMLVDNAGNGIIFGDMKNFVVEHPYKKDTDIWYASLEGPEVAAYDRGTATLVNGEVQIALSNHFKAIVNTSTMTVILTPHSADTYGLAVVKKGKDGFTVKEFKAGQGNFSFDWEVKCKRKGYENWRIERPSHEKQGVFDQIEKKAIMD